MIKIPPIYKITLLSNSHKKIKATGNGDNIKNSEQLLGPIIPSSKRRYLQSPPVIRGYFSPPPVAPVAPQKKGKNVKFNDSKLVEETSLFRPDVTDSWKKAYQQHKKPNQGFLSSLFRR